MTVRHKMSISTHFETVYNTKTGCVSLFINLKVSSLNTARTFVFMNRDKFLKVDFPPKSILFLWNFPQRCGVPLMACPNGPKLELVYLPLNRELKSFFKYYLNVSIGYQMIGFFHGCLRNTDLFSSSSQMN